MTAQVVIMNKLCAAVASDSSVTLSGAEGTRRAFPTADKILPLPSPHTVALLHSGDTLFLGVPYSVLAGQWVETLPSEPLGTVGDYLEHLMGWLEAQTSLFTEEVQTDYLEYLLRDYFLAVRRRLLTICEERGLGQDDWKSSEAEEAIAQVIDEAEEYLGSQPKLERWREVDSAAVLERHRKTWDEIREWVFDDTPRSAEGDAGLERLAVLLLGVFDQFSRDANLVLVGFGADEIFPAAQSVMVQGIVEDRLRTGPVDDMKIAMQMGSAVMPFGLTEAVHTFLRGYHPDFRYEAHGRLDKLASAFKELVGAGPALTSQIDAAAREAHDGLEADFKEVSDKSFIRPMTDTVAGLPPPELARMAESLVGLQVLRQLTQAEAETVGGPIDVAIVTRGEGLRWVRHKKFGVGGTLGATG